MDKFNELNLDQLENVTGGVVAGAGGGGTNSQNQSVEIAIHYCGGNCKKETTFSIYSGGRGYCTVCSWRLQ